MPSRSQTRLTMSVIRPMLLLAEQMKLWIQSQVSKRADLIMTSSCNGNAREERLPWILREHSDAPQMVSSLFQLLLKVLVLLFPLCVQRCKGSVELKVGAEQG